MREIIFIDETAFLALNDKDDPNYSEAVGFVKSLLNQTVKLTTSFLVLLETASELKKRKGFFAAKRFLEFFKTEGIEVLTENSSIRKEAEECFLRTGNQKEVGMPACHHVATMHYYNIRKIFSFSLDYDSLETIRVPRNSFNKGVVNHVTKG